MNAFIGLRKKKQVVDDDNEDLDAEYFPEDNVKIDDNVYVPNDKRITRPVLTKYERVRILGERARQLSLGAKPMIKGLINMDPKDVARLELKLKCVPLIIIRTLPTGKKERWRVNELESIN
jgi:RNA polymerase Rpb6.